MAQSDNQMKSVKIWSYMSEIVFRGYLAISASLAVLILSPEQIGRTTLAGSIGFIVSGLSNANWANRIQEKAKYRLDSDLALSEFLNLIILTTLISAFVLVIAGSSSVLNPALILLSILTYLIANVCEIFWGKTGRIGMNVKFVSDRFLMLATGGLTGILLFLFFQNEISFLLIQFIMWTFVLLGYMVRQLSSFGRIPESLNSFDFNLPSIETRKIVLGNLVINLSLVLDNLILGSIRSLDHVASYSIAFGICSLFVTVVGSTFQRLYSVEKFNFEIVSSLRRYIITGTGLLVIFLIVSFLTKDVDNSIIKNSPKVFLLLIPSIFFRIEVSKYSAFLSRFGGLKVNITNSLSTIFLLSIMGIPGAHFFGAYGMALATSLSYLFLYIYLRKKYQPFN